MKIKEKDSIAKDLHLFCTYIQINRWPIIISSLLLLLIYWPWIYSIGPHIDAETLINIPYATASWLELGRQGGIFTELIFGLRWFNPFISTLFGFIMLCISGILFGYMSYRAGKVNPLLSIGFIFVLFSYPIMTETLYFDMMIFKEAWAYVMCAVSVGLSYRGILYKSTGSKVIAIICMIWIFSTYQIFVVLYVTMAVFYYLLLYRRWSIIEERKIEPKQYGIIIGQLLIMFLFAMLINTCITKLFFSSSDHYLNNQAMWNTLPLGQCLEKIFLHILQVVTAKGIFYTSFYPVTAIISIICAVSDLRKVKTAKLGWLYIAAIIGLQFCPFLLTMYLGSVPVVRAQLVYPMVYTCNIAFIFNKIWGKRFIRGIFLTATTVFLWLQTQSTMRLIYTDQIRIQEDLHLASLVEQSIQMETKGLQKPIAFVGTYTSKLNAACAIGETIGLSIFNVDSNESPHYLVSSMRICNILKTLGYSFHAVNDTQILEARKEALDMPIWPTQGSIKDVGEYVIVKLSDDKWLADIMEPSLIPISLSNPENDDIINFSVDSVVIENELLTIKGWIFQNGVSSVTMMPEIYLMDKDSKQYYLLKTIRTHRPDLITAFESNGPYEYGGFYASAPINILQNSISQYSIVLGYRSLETGESSVAYSSYDLESLVK